MSGEQRQQARFVVLSTQRSGSNWIEDRLAGHPEIELRRHEIFRKSLDTPGSYQAFRKASLAHRVATTAIPPVAKFRYLSDLFGESIMLATGFRLMYDQLRRFPSLGLILPAMGVRVIHLVRANVLATHVSAQVAATSGKYVRRREQPPADEAFLNPDGLVEALRARVRLIERHRRLLKRLPHLEVSYEAFRLDPQGHDRQMLDFLGVDSSVSLGSTVTRLGRGSLAERIGNHRQVEQALSGTEFERWLNSD